MCGVLLRQPSDLIDLLLDLQTLKVVEFGLVALKGAVDIVLSLGEWLGLALWVRRKRRLVRRGGGGQTGRKLHSCSGSHVSAPQPCEDVAPTLHVHHDAAADTAGASTIYQSI